MAGWLQAKSHQRGLGCGLGCTPALYVSHSATAAAAHGLWRLCHAFALLVLTQLLQWARLDICIWLLRLDERIWLLLLHHKANVNMHAIYFRILCISFLCCR